MKPGWMLASIGALTLVALQLMHSNVMSRDGGESWGPYLKNRSGTMTPVPDRIEHLRDADWSKIAYTPYAGVLPRLAVYMASLGMGENPAASQGSDLLEMQALYSKRGGKQPDGSDNPETQLRHALSATNRFRLSEWDPVMDNLVFGPRTGDSERLRETGAPRLERMFAKYLVRVRITAIDPEMSAKDIAVTASSPMDGSRALGSVGGKGKVAYVRLDAQLVNTGSGAIAASLIATGTSGRDSDAMGTGLIAGLSRSRGVSSAPRGSINAVSASALGEAFQVAANKIAYLVASIFEEERLSLRMMVVGADDGMVSIEGGKDLGLKPGMMFSLASNQGPLTAAGDTLDGGQMPNGRIRITRVLPTVSICEYVEILRPARRGDWATFEPEEKK